MTNTHVVPSLTFGNGNIILTSHRGDDGVSLMLSGSPRPFNIGTVKGIITDEELAKLVPLLAIKFLNVESIDMVISALRTLRRDKFFNPAEPLKEGDQNDQRIL